MGVEITHKEKSVVEESITTHEIAVETLEKIDAYGSAAAELKAKLEELEPLEKLVKELATDLVGEGEHFGAEKVVDLAGVLYDVELSKKSMAVIEIDKKVLRKTLGKDTYFELAKIGVGDIRKYCTPPQIAKILTEERTGKRRISVTKKL